MNKLNELVAQKHKIIKKNFFKKNTWDNKAQLICKENCTKEKTPSKIKT